MAIEKGRKIFLFIVSLLWGVAGILCICPAGAFVMFYDVPLGGIGAGLGLLDYALIAGVVSFPVACLVSSIGIQLLKDRTKRLALSVSLLPALPLLLLFSAYTGSNMSSCGSFDCSGGSTMRGQGNAAQLAECASPGLDGGDGLDTTGCGALEIGAVATGATTNTSQAHNWQFSAQSGVQVTITVENDRESCPHIRILDSDGGIVEAFEEKNRLILCPSGMISTSFFYFTPPSNGSYIIRLFTPTDPGAYWLKIKR